MPANVDAMVREGINAFKTGNKEDARALLMKAAEIDPYNEQAWLWLSAVVDSPEDQRTCLENVLAINPDNERARNGLQILTQQDAPPAAPPAPTNAYEDEFPTSVEWDMGGLPSSSPSARPPIEELSDEDYDDWLTNLNLPSASDSAPAPSFSESPFGDIDLDDDDVFNDGPFSADQLDEMFTPVSTAAQAPPPPPPPAPEPPAPPVRSSVMSPGPETVTFSNVPAAPSFQEVGEVNDLFTRFDGDYYEDEDLSELNADELFGYIPPEIRPTRLPGTKEGQPLLLTLGLVLLFLLNLGAAALLVYRLI